MNTLTSLLRRACLLVALLVPPALLAGDTHKAAVDRAEELLTDGKYDEALSLLAPLREDGKGEVAYLLAYLHYLRAVIGRQVADVSRAEVAEAVRLAKRALRQGSSEAANLLYIIHSGEIPAHADAELARRYLLRGVKSGDSGARLNYFLHLDRGSDLFERDTAKACELMRGLAKENEVIGALRRRIGWMMVRGECGFSVDRVVGMGFIATAAREGDSDAQRDMGRAAEEGFAVDRSLAAALKWYETAAGNGDGYSLWRIGLAYVRGEEREPDARKAVDYFQRAVDAGSVDGMVSLAVMYATGDGVARDLGRARDLYQQAADAGDVHALRNLAVMHHRGEAMPVDRVQSLFLLRQVQALDGDDVRDMLVEVREQMSEVQVHEADRRFAAWEAERAARGRENTER